MNTRKIISLALVVAMVGGVAALSGCTKRQTTTDTSTVSTTSQTSNSETVSVDYNLTNTIKEGVILHAWCWSFNTIKESMADIAAAGYSTIQTSPINAVYEGGNGGMQLMGQGKWYYQYQPTDWKIGNYQLGTEEEFKAMCEEAHKYGIKVIVDVVPNHTATETSAVSQSLIDAAGGSLYHKNGLTEISNYGDRTQCTTGQMGGLPDVNTENKGFQDYFIAYLNQCIADGADGFRYDTAKHIGLPDDPQDDASLPNNFWERVTTEITNANTIFNYGEVLQGDNERIADYIKAIGATTASGYGANIRSAVKNGRLTASTLTNFGVGGSDSVVTWVESHDNYTDGTSLSLTDDQIIQAWAIIAARAKGTPLFYDRPYGATSDAQWGNMNRIGAAGSDLYKDETVVAVNHFRNAMTGEGENIKNPSASDTSVVMIERGTKGLVVVNSGSSAYNLNTTTTLADGTYTDRAKGSATFTVSSGTITGSVPAGSVVVLYNDGYVEIGKPVSFSADTSDFIFYTDTQDVTLHVSNGTEATYTINGGTSTSFTDGTKITLGDVVDDENTIYLTLSAKNENGAVSNMTFVFLKKVAAADGTTIYFEKPSTWKDKVYAYVYDESGSTVKNNAAWPGVEMTKDADGKYSYVLEGEWQTALVIFSDGTNQYPKTMEPGCEVADGQTYTPN
ncbi:MAG: starch-binding protein [Acutalibacteraceae bacterium]